MDKLYKKKRNDVDNDGMIDEILRLARKRNWPRELVETCMDAMSSKEEKERAVL